MTINDISEFMIRHYHGVKIVHVWGEKSFFYNPDGLLQRGVYFCTLKDKDGDNDKASGLHRNDVFRLNFAISKQTFITLFNDIPKRPIKGSCIQGNYDFTSIDQLTPHPVYGWMTWVSIINPSSESWSSIVALLDESYIRSCKRYTTLLTKNTR